MNIFAEHSENAYYRLQATAIFCFGREKWITVDCGKIWNIIYCLYFSNTRCSEELKLN
jgi:hypothetical protein